MNVYQPHLLRSSLETPHVTIIIQDKDTNPKSFLVILREPENVLNVIYHYCLEACQLVLLIKSTPIVLMASQIILNSTCWPAMKIAVKLELLRMRSCISWHVCLPLYYVYITYIFISCIVYRLFYFTSRNCISSCLLFIYLNNVVCTCSCLLFTYVYSVFSRSCIIVIMVTLK